MTRKLAIIISVLLLASPCLAGMGRNIVKDSTSQTTYIRIVDSADGTPETGVTEATSGIDLEYVRLGAAPVDITEDDLGSTSAAWATGGLIHVGSGVYRVDLPNLACATGVDQVSVQGTITGMVVLGVTHPLVDLSLSGQSAIDLKDFADNGYDPSGDDIVGMGSTGRTEFANTFYNHVFTGNTTANTFGFSLNNPVDLESEVATALATWGGATGGNLTSLASQGSVNTIDDFLDTEVAAILGDTNELQTDWANGGRLDLLIDSTLADTNELQTDLVNGGRLDLLIDAILADTTVIGTPAGASIAEDIADIEGGGGGGGGMTAAETRSALGLASANLDTQLAAIDDAVDSEVAAIKAKTDNLPTDPADESNQTAEHDATQAALGTVSTRVLLGVPAAAPGSGSGVATATNVNAIEITPTVELVDGGPFEHQIPSEAFTLRLGTRRDGTATTDRPIRIRPGETRTWAVECSSQMRAGDYLEAMEEPALDDNGDLSVAATEGTYGVNRTLMIFKVTAQADATGTGTVELEATPAVGETLLVSVPVKVLQ